MRTRQHKIISFGLMLVLIVLLSVLLLLLMADKPTNAMNTRTTTQLKQYIHALELIRLEKGVYPGPETFVCLGDYPDDACWHEQGTGHTEDPTLNEQLQKYIPILSAGPMIESDVAPEQSREGYIYRRVDDGRHFEIQYFLKGAEKSCGMGDAVTLETNKAIHQGNTWCHIRR